MVADTRIPLLNCTRATFRLAELGFLGAVVYTRTQMPRLHGLPCSARYFTFRVLPFSRVPRSSWLVVSAALGHGAAAAADGAPGRSGGASADSPPQTPERSPRPRCRCKLLLITLLHPCSSAAAAGTCARPLLLAAPIAQPASGSHFISPHMRWLVVEGTFPKLRTAAPARAASAAEVQPRMDAAAAVNAPAHTGRCVAAGPTTALPHADALGMLTLLHVLMLWITAAAMHACNAGEKVMRMG
eukprot:364891-Chlamydomonas_euryale.AAC.6